MRSLRPLVPLVAVLASMLLAGCGSSSYSTYTDAKYGFSLQYPSGWAAPKVSTATADGVPSRIVAFTTTGFQTRIAVNSVRPNISKIRNGEEYNQGAQTLTFFRRTVSGLPAVLIQEKTNGMPLDHESVHLNSKRYGYDIQLASDSTISKSTQSTFNRLVNSFKVGKSG